MSIRKAVDQDLRAVEALFQEVIGDMHARGFRQWVWGEYPSAEILRGDVDKQRLYLVEDAGALAGAFVACDGQTEEYAALDWHFGVKPCTLHRVALHPACFGKGYGREVVNFAMRRGREAGCDCIRLDTSSENARALKLFSGMMERYVGEVFFEGHDEPFRAFEARLTEDCPLLPLALKPAFRYGDSTPWGGDGLRRAFGMRIPDERTGEALVISAIPGLESEDATGAPLSELIARYGARLTGENGAGEFPLLLKLIAAREQLSVQVHPDDAYAGQHEHKLGKSEAWVILHADENAKILYGLRPGVTLEALRAALGKGEDIEPMIDAVPARAGDVFYMPSGMVHAIGGGVVLYEIQQSSDVTYRLWDYNRVNAKGEKRPLHLAQALDVIRPALCGQRETLPARAPGVYRLLDVPAFRLECVCVNGEQPVPARPESFQLLTALDSLLLQWEGDAIDLAPGQSVLLPASCPPAALAGVGRALLAYPGKRLDAARG